MKKLLLAVAWCALATPALAITCAYEPLTGLLLCTSGSSSGTVDLSGVSDGDVLAKVGAVIGSATAGECMDITAGAIGVDTACVPRWSIVAGVPTAANTAGRDYALNSSANQVYVGIGGTSWKLVSSNVFAVVDTGGDDTYAPTSCAGFPSAYANDQVVILQATTANTGAASLDCGPGAKAIKLPDGTTDPTTDGIAAKRPAVLQYDASANAAAGAWILLVSSGGSSVTAGPGLKDVSNTWNFNPTDARVVFLQDEFISGSTAVSTNYTGNLNWTTLGTSATFAYRTSATWPNLGVHRSSTQSTAQSIATLHWSGSGGGTIGGLLSNTDKPWAFAWVFSLPSIADVRSAVGMSALNSAALPVDGIYVRFDTSTTNEDDDTGKFRFVAARTADGPVEIPSTVSADTGFHTLVVESDNHNNGGSNAEKIWMSIDNETAVSVCASGCTLTATFTALGLSGFVSIGNDATGAKSIDTDFFGFYARVANTSAKVR